MARKTPNTAAFAGNRRKANAYADSVDVTTCAAVTITATIVELRMARPSLPSLHAWRNVSSVTDDGSRGSCNTLLPGFNAPTTIT